MKVQTLSIAFVSALVIVCTSAYGKTLRCEIPPNSDDSTEVKIVATVESKLSLFNFSLVEPKLNAAYGSKDVQLNGLETGKYIRFTPHGGANAEYRFAIPSNFLKRKSFPLFLDTWFEGTSGWNNRVLSCQLDN